jgi:hypothetical protein
MTHALIRSVRAGLLVALVALGSAGTARIGHGCRSAAGRDVDGAHFGWRNLIVHVGDRSFLVVGEPQHDFGAMAAAGQIYLYRVSSP